MSAKERVTFDWRDAICDGVVYDYKVIADGTAIGYVSKREQGTNRRWQVGDALTI